LESVSRVSPLYTTVFGFMFVRKVGPSIVKAGPMKQVDMNRKA
jgi:hypothetical protein